MDFKYFCCYHKDPGSIPGREKILRQFFRVCGLSGNFTTSTDSVKNMKFSFYSIRVACTSSSCFDFAWVIFRKLLLQISKTVKLSKNQVKTADRPGKQKKTLERENSELDSESLYLGDVLLLGVFQFLCQLSPNLKKTLIFS